MKMEREDGTVYEEPTPEVIRSVLQELGYPGTEFVILGRSDQIYIQSYADSEQHCSLEYRDGSEEQHFRCPDQYLSVEQVTEAFLGFASLQEDWLDKFFWVPLYTPPD